MLNLSSDDMDSYDISALLSQGENSSRGRLNTGAAQFRMESAILVFRIVEISTYDASAKGGA